MTQGEAYSGRCVGNDLVCLDRIVDDRDTSDRLHNGSTDYRSKSTSQIEEILSRRQPGQRPFINRPV